MKRDDELEEVSSKWGLGDALPGWLLEMLTRKGSHRVKKVV
jgi:hypothetical protein